MTSPSVLTFRRQLFGEGEVGGKGEHRRTFEENRTVVPLRVRIENAVEERGTQHPIELHTARHVMIPRLTTTNCHQGPRPVFRQPGHRFHNHIDAGGLRL